MEILRTTNQQKYIFLLYIHGVLAGIGRINGNHNISLSSRAAMLSTKVYKILLLWSKLDPPFKHCASFEKLCRTIRHILPHNQYQQNIFGQEPQNLFRPDIS